MLDPFASTTTLCEHNEYLWGKKIKTPVSKKRNCYEIKKSPKKRGKIISRTIISLACGLCSIDSKWAFGVGNGLANADAPTFIDAIHVKPVDNEAHVMAIPFSFDRYQAKLRCG